MQHFPRLDHTLFEIKSPQDVAYNCIAWAAGDDQHWWEPTESGGFFWPANLPVGSTAYTVANYIAAFESLGYRATESSEFETGVEKVAIYQKPPSGFHAARQVDGGTWVSKLGRSFDIEHVDLACLTGSDYGDVVAILARATDVD